MKRNVRVSATRRHAPDSPSATHRKEQHNEH